MEKFNKVPNKITDQTPIEGVLTVGDVLEELYSLTSLLLHDIKDLAESGKIGVVLGVDASGRLPALLLWSVLNHIQPVELRFIAGRRGADNGVFYNIFAKTSERQKALQQKYELKQWLTSGVFKELQNTDKEVLIVDDTVSSGDSLSEICKILRDSSIKYKVAALSFQHFRSPDTVAERLGLLSDDLFFAHRGSILGYGHEYMYGVTKTPGDVHASLLDKEDREIHNKMVRYTRKRLKRISEQLASEMGWL